ncbi:hypothetical protein KM043_018299 [Ampulex compressa]|nr:hypothetical protein KM043_018299 [Ampulex compressa]
MYELEYTWLREWRILFMADPLDDDESILDLVQMIEKLIADSKIPYNGHGSGIQYLSGEQIEKLRVKAIVLLFGCSSVKLLAVGGRFPPYGVSNQYLIASSPCVLGMLWEVTDADIDKMTANFISSWIPSSCDRPWSEVDTNAWCSGTLKFQKTQQKVNGNESNTLMEPEMLRAVAKSKDACSQYMTAAAIVVRGLPIRLV